MKFLLRIVCLAVTLSSCQKSSTTGEDVKVSAAYEKARNEFFSNLKEPVEAAAQLAATGAAFQPNLMSDPVNFASYTGNKVSAAMNLGIYLADLNYSVAYRQSENTKDLFGAAYELSKTIGIEDRVLGFLMTRYHEHISHNDSVAAVLNELFEKSIGGLQGTKEEKLAGIAIAAYQVENLHLALGVIESYPKDLLPGDATIQILAPLYRLVLDQQQNIETILAFLNAIVDPLDPDQNPNYPYYASALQGLIDVYKRLDFEERLASGRAHELMNDAVVQELHQKVSVIRNKMME